MKRFTETGKWDDPWFRGLTGVQKLVFLYVIDRCNNAGFWEIDEDMMSYQTKLKIELVQGAWKGLERGLIAASGWVWVRRFLRHQKNENLNPENPAHKQIIALISEQEERFKENDDFLLFVAPFKGLLSPIGKGQVKVREGGSAEGGRIIADDVWIEGVEKMDCYKGLNIKTELGKAQAWCGTNRRQCTRKFFTNWLIRALDTNRTISTNGHHQQPSNPRNVGHNANADYSKRTPKSLPSNGSGDSSIFSTLPDAGESGPPAST